jgi:transcriptional regulator with XRE-family HTH domain
LAHHPVDVHVGARLRQRRLRLGMSQTALGKAAGIAYQQVQKYESGRDLISSSRLFEFAKILDVPVPYFFEEMAPGLSAKRRKVAWPKRNSGGDPDIKLESETFEFVRAYYKIGNDDVRQRVRVMVQALAGKA